MVLIDGTEGMRAHSDYAQTAATAHDPQRQWVWADVTPIYRENFADITEVSRRTQLHHDRLVTIVDRVRAGADHRGHVPFCVPARGGDHPRRRAGAHTRGRDAPAGGYLGLNECVDRGGGPRSGQTRRPRSILVDFSSTGSEVERVFVGPDLARSRHGRACGGCRGDPRPRPRPDMADARDALETTPWRVPMQLPAYQEAELPNATRWWYRAVIDKRTGPAWLQLPVGMPQPRAPRRLGVR